MKVKFTIREELLTNEIDALELSERASNCMKRASIQTIGDLTDRIETLSEIKGCGVKVQREVKNSLFNYALGNAKDVKTWLKKVEVSNV